MIKRHLQTKVAKGFYYACDDIQANERYIVYSGTETYPMAHNTKAISLGEILHRLQPTI